MTQTMPARLADRSPAVLAAWQTYWQTDLELLFAAPHGDVRCSWPTERTDELRGRYAERLARHQR